MTKIIKIEICGNCPNCIGGCCGNSEKYYCNETEEEIKDVYTISSLCPLPNFEIY